MLAGIRAQLTAGVVALLTAALFVCAVSPATEAAVIGSGGLKYVTKNFDLRPGAPRTTKASCPSRTNVLGGGHYNSGGFGDVLGLHSFPYDSDDRNNRPDDGWAATQHAFGEVVPAKVYAICARVTPCVGE